MAVKRRFAVAGLVAVALGAAIRVSTQTPVRRLSRPAAPKSTSVLAGRVGPFGGIASANDARDMAADGLTLAVGPATETRSLLRDRGVRYIDAHLWSLVYSVCLRQFAAEQAALQPLACEVSKTDEDAIATQAAAHLKSIELDPGLAGLWILDDYPRGEIGRVLTRLRGIVQESNARTGFRRFTICGVGGSLDFKRHVDDASFTQDRRYMNLALRNVSPAACDMVSPYFYGSAAVDDPRLIDWSMQDLLPSFLQALQAQGYDLSDDVIVPIAHAFSAHAAGSTSYYVTPRPEDIATQMKAYCDSASSILFFTWRSKDADRSYAISADLRAGVQQGRAACLQIWRQREAARAGTDLGSPAP